MCNVRQSCQGRLLSVGYLGKELEEKQSPENGSNISKWLSRSVWNREFMLGVAKYKIQIIE